MTRIEPSGILVVDKPAGTTSAKVVALVKKLLGAQKVGHTGTLDPMATGVLACCINRATKLARFFLHGNKFLMFKSADTGIIRKNGGSDDG